MRIFYTEKQGTSRENISFFELCTICEVRNIDEGDIHNFILYQIVNLKVLLG